jgi:hypothetical protein
VGTLTPTGKRSKTVSLSRDFYVRTRSRTRLLVEENSGITNIQATVNGTSFTFAPGETEVDISSAVNPDTTATYTDTIPAL